jgi:hypothetical protein
MGVGACQINVAIDVLLQRVDNSLPTAYILDFVNQDVSPAGSVHGHYMVIQQHTIAEPVVNEFLALDPTLS